MTERSTARARAIVVALALLVSVAFERAAQACWCDYVAPSSIVYPIPEATDVPTNSRILLRHKRSEVPWPFPFLVYDHLPDVLVTGNIEAIGDDFLAFVPHEALQPNTRMTMVWGKTWWHSFSVGAARDDTPPRFEGVASFEAAIKGEVVSDEHTSSCTVGPGGKRDIYDIRWKAAIDDGASGAPLLYRVFVHSPGGSQPPASLHEGLGLQGVEPICGVCSRFPSHEDRPLGAVGSTVCVRVQVEDTAGNKAGFEAQACTKVRKAIVNGYCTVLSMDSELGANAGVDASDGGCSLRMGSSEESNPWAPGVVMLLFWVGWGWRRMVR